MTFIAFAGLVSQCTFWCSVLSDFGAARGRTKERCGVSMHLLVLSAFRHSGSGGRGRRASLNAPSGAQCFPTACRISTGIRLTVSMHLLVLSAFRRDGDGKADISNPAESQCTFWCSVLSDRTRSA